MASLTYAFFPTFQVSLRISLSEVQWHTDEAYKTLLGFYNSFIIHK